MGGGVKEDQHLLVVPFKKIIRRPQQTGLPPCAQHDVIKKRQGSNEMSSNSSNSDSSKEKEKKEDSYSSEANLDLRKAAGRSDVSAVQQALRNGANVNCTSDGTTPLMNACDRGCDEIVRILLDAGADAHLNLSRGWSAIDHAIVRGHLSTVEMLLKHDKSLLETVDILGETPLLCAIGNGQGEIVRFLMNRGANVHATSRCGEITTLMKATRASIKIVRWLLAAGVDVEARNTLQRTALHCAAENYRTDIERELIVEHNANIFAVNEFEKTPFDSVITRYRHSRSAFAILIRSYGTQLTREHGGLALHAVLGAAEYSRPNVGYNSFPQNPLRIRLPLGTLAFMHFRALLSHLDANVFRTRDASGKLPIHIACRNNAPEVILALILEYDTATLHVGDYQGALPLHELCCGAVDHCSVRFLVQHGGVSTLAAGHQDGALPLHLLCGSTCPSLQTVQYMIQFYPEAVAVRTKAGQYPFMIAACEASTASLSVVYELVRTNPDLVIPH